MDRINSIVKRKENPKVFAGWTLDHDTRFRSTSGGAFSELGHVILDHGGYIAGAKYNDHCMVEHDLIHNDEGLKKLRQSKYVQSDLGDIYKRVREKLNNDDCVAFVGAPCQVAGLYSFLGKDYNNLITIDFICRGMNSPKAYKAWLNEIEEKAGSKAVRVWFKYKVGGWKTSPRRIRVDFENRKHVVYEDEKNLFMYGYMTTNLFIKPSCGNCQFKGFPRWGDITLADFWGVDKKFDDDRGTSLIMINSEKGDKLFEVSKKRMEVHETDFNRIFGGNVCINTSVTISEYSRDFLRDLDYMPFSDALKKYDSYPSKLPFIQRVNRKARRSVKKLLYKIKG